MKLRYIITLLLASLNYIFAHELGHYLVANIFNLSPNFVTSPPSAGLFAFSMGISYLPTTLSQNLLVILGATILPLVLLTILTIYSLFRESYELNLFLKIYIILIIVNLIPIPLINQLDANKLWLGLLT